MDDDTQEIKNEIRELTKKQRRVLGVLVEKALTTPEYYPLTIKALTSGCNQKSNRDPVTSYSEDDIQEIVEELKALGLAATVHTESGRSERVRHYTRKKFEFSEPQLAIVTELLLRGRQQMGELRSRASRMVAIDSQDDLRRELSGLRELKFVTSSGTLEKRGVEIDHAFYTSNEKRRMGFSEAEDETTHTTADASNPTTTLSERSIPSDGLMQSQSAFQETLQELQMENRSLRSELEDIKSQVETLSAELDDLKQQLGV